MARKDEETLDPVPPGADEMSEREVDRTLADSFPASDPPSWTLGTDHADAPPDDSSDTDKEQGS